MQTDAFGQLFQRFLVKFFTGLIGIRLDFGQRDLRNAVGCPRSAQIGRVRAEQVGQAAAQPFFA